MLFTEAGSTFKVSDEQFWGRAVRASCDSLRVTDALNIFGAFLDSFHFTQRRLADHFYSVVHQHAAAIPLDCTPLQSPVIADIPLCENICVGRGRFTCNGVVIFEFASSRGRTFRSSAQALSC